MTFSDYSVCKWQQKERGEDSCLKTQPQAIISFIKDLQKLMHAYGTFQSKIKISAVNVNEPNE